MCSTCAGRVWRLCDKLKTELVTLDRGLDSPGYRARPLRVSLRSTKDDTCSSGASPAPCEPCWQPGPAPMPGTFVMTLAGPPRALCHSVAAQRFQSSLNHHWIYCTFHLNDFVAISERNSIRVVRSGLPFCGLSVGHCVPLIKRRTVLRLSDGYVTFILHQTKDCPTIMLYSSDFPPTGQW